MAQLEPKPDPFKPGQQNISAESLNKIVRAVVRQVRGGGGTDVSYYGDRVIVSSKDSKPTVQGISNYVAQFTVVKEFKDYLLCIGFFQPINEDGISSPQLYDAVIDPANIQRVYVAKPYILQQTPWDGKTVDGKLITYTGLAARNYGTTAQTITPKYIAGDVILATKATSGYYDPDNDHPVAWMDVNSAGRSWMASTAIDTRWKQYSWTLPSPQTYNDLVLEGRTDGSDGTTYVSQPKVIKVDVNGVSPSINIVVTGLEYLPYEDYPLVFLGDSFRYSYSDPIGKMYLTNKDSRSLQPNQFIIPGCVDSFVTSCTLNGTTIISVPSSPTPIKVGMVVYGIDIQDATVVTVVSGTNITLSNTATGSTTTNLTFVDAIGIGPGDIAALIHYNGLPFEYIFWHVLSRLPL